MKMNSSYKRIFLSLLSTLTVLIMCFASACSLVPNDEGKDPTTSPAAGGTPISSKFTDEELKTAVITIGDYTVTLERYLEFYNEIANYYKTYYSYDIASDATTLSTYLKKITDTLSQEKMELYQASNLNLANLNEDQLKEVEENYKTDVDELYEYYKQKATTDKESDDTVVIKDRVDEYILSEAQYYLGASATVEEYMEYLHDSAHDGYIKDLLKAELCKDIKVTDKDVLKWYDDALKDDKKFYTENPQNYKEERESYDTVGTVTDKKTAVPPLYVPKEYARVLHIFTTANQTFSEDYTKNKTAMDDLMKEYGTLALEDRLAGTKTNTKRLAEIVKEYEKLSDKNKTEYDKVFADAKERIEQAYAKLEKGEDFTEVMKKYTEDTYLKSNEKLQKLGLLLSTEYTSKDDWSTAAKTEFDKIKKGQYTKVFSDNSGFHILFYLDNEKPGAVAYDDVSSIILDYLLPAKQDERYEAKIKEWMEDKDNVIVINNELLDKVGK